MWPLQPGFDSFLLQGLEGIAIGMMLCGARAATCWPCSAAGV